MQQCQQSAFPLVGTGTGRGIFKGGTARKAPTHGHGETETGRANRKLDRMYKCETERHNDIKGATQEYKKVKDFVNEFVILSNRYVLSDVPQFYLDSFRISGLLAMLACARNIFCSSSMHTFLTQDGPGWLT